VSAEEERTAHVDSRVQIQATSSDLRLLEPQRSSHERGIQFLEHAFFLELTAPLHETLRGRIIDDRVDHPEARRRPSLDAPLIWHVRRRRSRDQRSRTAFTRDARHARETR
jgi:hypothetical protein